MWPQPQNASITSSALSGCPPSRVERESCATLVGLRLTKCLLTCGMSISMAAYNTRVLCTQRPAGQQQGAVRRSRCRAEDSCRPLRVAKHWQTVAVHFNHHQFLLKPAHQQPNVGARHQARAWPLPREGVHGRDWRRPRH